MRTAPAASPRLLIVHRHDPGGRYEWLGEPRPGDVLVAFDWLAHEDLAARGALLFDRLQSWEQRDADDRRVDELLAAIRAHPRVAALAVGEHRLVDYAAVRLREELTRALRGWTVAQAAPDARGLVCDPSAPAALQMGVRAALGLDPAPVPYALAPALAGSAFKRALARPVMRAVAARSRPARVRVAAVAAGKLMLALAALPGEQLRAAGVGTMPFPGIDHGNSAVLALRRGLPMLATFGPSPRRLGGGAGRHPGRVAELPGEPLGVVGDGALDRALGLLVARVLAAAAPELQGVVGTLARLERAVSLRALLLPNAGYGATHVLIAWARRRGLRVGVMQHGAYVHRDHAEDQIADVVLTWGEGTEELARGWPEPRPRLLPVGVPGVPPTPPRPPAAPPHRVLVTATSGVDTPFVPVTLSEEFIATVAPGLAAMAAAGVELRLRPHPTEDPARYRRLLDRHGLAAVAVAADGLFVAAAGWADMVIASASSTALETAVMGTPILMWNGGAPERMRQERFSAPWSWSDPGMFDGAERFRALAGLLMERPPAGLAVARALSARLACLARPFYPDHFAEGLRLLGAP